MFDRFIGWVEHRLHVRKLNQFIEMVLNNDKPVIIFANRKFRDALYNWHINNRRFVNSGERDGFQGLLVGHALVVREDCEDTWSTLVN